MRDDDPVSVDGSVKLFVQGVPLSNHIEPDDDATSSGAVLHVNCIGPSDGKAALVRVAQKLAQESIAQGKEKSFSVDVNLVDEMLQKDAYPEVRFPEPQLIYVVGEGRTGEALELDGFPPWSIRLSEFL
ncbi:hypothetical protein HK104_009731 [Borealophlyctis nickersoniae]|nr:hypothetical protein HK104_009731 [Borealophlyctis nickersoniae]